MNTTQLMDQGTEFARNLKLKDAENCFSKVLSMDPRSSDAIIWLGRIAFIQGDTEKGDRLLDEAISINSAEPQALTFRGISELEKGDTVKALEYFSKAEASNPRLEIHGYFARCYSLLGRKQEAEQAAQKAIQMNPQDTLGHYELACICADQGKVVDALKHLVASVNSNPLFVKGYFALGALLALAGKPEEAIDVYRKGLQYVPDAHLLREQLCGLLASQGMFQEAIDETYECIRRRNSYDDHLRLGLYSVILGQFETAEKAFLKALELNPQNWEAHYNLGELYSAANLVEEARLQYESALSKGEDEWKPYNGMGVWILQNGQNRNDAIPFFQKANELDKSRPEPLMNLALTFASLREWDIAKSHCNKIMQTAPSESKYYKEAERLVLAIDSENF